MRIARWREGFHDIVKIIEIVQLFTNLTLTSGKKKPED
jgi:hypothetical protein